MKKWNNEVTVEDEIYSKSKHTKVKSKPPLREPEFVSSKGTVSDSGFSSQQQNVEAIRKSSYMHLFELKAKVQGKLPLSFSPINAKTKVDKLTSKPAVDYRTKVRSWLIHEELNLSSAPITKISDQIDKVSIRHSSRKRIKPIEYWNNETVIYDDNGTLKYVEKPSNYLELTGCEVKTKNLTRATLETDKESRLPLKKKTNGRSHNVINIDITKDKKVDQQKTQKSNQDKSINLKRRERPPIKRKICEEDTEEAKADLVIVSKISNIKTSQITKKAKLETNPLPSTDLVVGVRRGGRNRIKPIAYWDNEFVRYDEYGNFMGIERVEEIEKNKNNARHKSSEEKSSKISSVALSSEPPSHDSGETKKKNKSNKKKINTTDLAIKIIQQSKRRPKKNIKVGQTEYPFSHLNKKSSFTLGRKLETIIKNGNIRKKSPIKVAENIRNQAKSISKENTTRKQMNSNINEKTLIENVNANEEGLQSDEQEKSCKEACTLSATAARRSRRSRISPVEYWNGHHIQYEDDGTLAGVEDWKEKTLAGIEDWKEKTRLKSTPMKELSNDNAKEAAKNDVSSTSSRRRLFEPTASNTINANIETATATLSVQIHPYDNKNGDVCISRAGIDVTVPINTDASSVKRDVADVTGSLEAYVQSMADYPDRTNQSKTVTQDKPVDSGGESPDTTTGYDETDKHEFYPITDPNTGLVICHMAKSVCNAKYGIYTGLILIQGSRKSYTWDVTEGSAVFVLEGIGTVHEKLGKETIVTPLEPNVVVNLVKGSTVTLSYNVRRSPEPLIVMLVVGGTSMECPELAEELKIENK